MALTPATENHERGIYSTLADLLACRHGASDLDVFKPQRARSMLLGNVRSRFRGRGMELEEVRLYQPGDDVRSIDWRVSARTGRTHTKLFAEERERPVHIIVDQRSTMFFGSAQRFKSVMAAELAAWIAWASLSNSDRIGGQIIGDHHEHAVRAKRNRKAVMQVLRHIAESNAQLPGPGAASVTMTMALENCRRITRPGTAIFIISDLHDFDAAAMNTLASLGRHTDIVLLRTIDPLESSLELSGQFGFSDGRNIATVEMSNPLVTRYQDVWDRQSDFIYEAAAGAGALLRDAMTDTEPRDVLARLYRPSPARPRP